MGIQGGITKVGDTRKGRLLENDATRIQRMIEGATDGGSSTVSTQRGSSGGALSSGSSVSAGSSPAPVTSPFSEALLVVPDSGSDSLDFGDATGIVAATCLVYMERDTSLVGVGWLEIWIDGSGNAQIVPDLFGSDCGMDFTVDASGGSLILTATDTGGTGDTDIDLVYCTEGVTIAYAWGIYHATRGALVERGRFSIIQNGATVSVSRRARGDDCGLGFTGSISAGILQLTVAADNASTDDVAIVFSPDQMSTAGAWQWELQALSVVHNSSASTAFQVPDSGSLIWSNDSLTVPADSSGSPVLETFPVGDGCDHIAYSAFRGTRWESGFIHIYNDLSTGGFALTVWDAELTDLGLTLDGTFTGTQLILSAYTDNSDALDTALYLTWIPRTQL